MKKFLFLCAAISIFALLPSLGNAQTQGFFCTGAIYSDSFCTTLQQDWSGCLGGDETGQCVAQSSPAGGTAPIFRMATFCTPSANCGGSGILPVTLKFSASSLSIVQGESSTLSWQASDAATSCSASDAWRGDKLLSGSERVSPTDTRTYTLTCFDSQQTSITESVTITVDPAPTQTPGTETVNETVGSGGTVTTDSEGGGDGTTASDPIETSVTTPVAGQVIIAEIPTASSAPAGFSFLARQVNVTAPPGSLGNPLILSFQLNLSLVPAGQNPNTLRVFQDRNPIVANCPANSCVSNITVSGDTIIITIRTVTASAWNFGFVQQVAAAGGSGCSAPGPPDQVFSSSVHGCNGTVTYANADNLCAAGWHVGDIVNDPGLRALLEATPSNNVPGPDCSGPLCTGHRWFRINGDPGPLIGIDSLVRDCYGEQAPCTAAYTGAPGHPTHRAMGGKAMFDDNVEVLSDNADSTRDSTPQGTICVDDNAPPLLSGGLIPCGNTPDNPCNFCHIFQLISNVITFFLVPSANLNNNIPLVPVIAGLLVAIGGFFMLTSAANPQNLGRGRTILFAVVVGLIIIYGSWVFLNLLFVALGIASFVGFGGTWWEINCAFQ